MKSRFFILLTYFLLLNTNFSYGQFQKVEHDIVFKSKIDNPINIEVIDRGDKFSFKAFNRSFYSYQLELKISDIINLTPEYVTRTFLLMPGRNNLLTLNLKDKEKRASYKYTIKYIIGVPSKNVDFEYPYLIPVIKPFKLCSKFNDSNTYISDCFKLSKGDTIFNMRKGYVSAVPNMFHDADRISDKKSLEIVHKDGTIMIYSNINPDLLFVKPGSAVYPGQPLGIINNDLAFNVFLYMNKGNGKLKRLNINYSIDYNKTEQFSKGMINSIIHPVDIINKEMTKRELRKYNKNQLY